MSNNNIASFVAEHLPTINTIIRREELEIKGLGNATFDETGEGGYFLQKKSLSFRNDFKAHGFEVSVGEVDTSKHEIASAPWPQEIAVAGVISSNLPSPFKEQWVDASEDHKFEYKNRSGNILMLELRIDKNDGQKSYPTLVPVEWSDGSIEWLPMRPNKSHLFGLEELPNFGNVIIVEGAKAALKAREIREGQTERAKAHPFREFLAHNAIVAFPNGAYGAQQADWEPLNKAGFSSAVIWPDNDEIGRSAVRTISKALNCSAMWVRTEGSTFPISWDLADDPPRKKGIYSGPAFKQMLRPATWMTNLIESPDSNKKVAVLRAHAANDFAYITKIDRFYHKQTGTMYTSSGLNKDLREYSDVKTVDDLLLAGLVSKYDEIGYRPDKDSLKVFNDDACFKFNIYRPTTIEPQSGDIRPFLNFMEHLIPDEEEREQLLMWCATLFAKPSIRMRYGVLLISNETGVGKGLLGHQVIAPLVGKHNVSFPNASSVDRDFNEWQRAKRVAIIDEIYTGASKKFADRIKSAITDDTVEINSKGDKEYELENWIVPYATSNSMAAMYMEDRDRRWFLPTVTETSMQGSHSTQFVNWLQNENGLAIILHWANKRTKLSVIKDLWTDGSLN